MSSALPLHPGPAGRAVQVGPEADPAGPTLTLATFLPYRLSVLAASVSDGLARHYEERFGIAIPEWRVIATVGEFGSLTAKAIGAHARMSKVKVSRAAAALERRGLICREPNPADGREAFLALTPAGRDVYRDITPLALAYAEAVTAGLSPAERVQLDLLLAKLMRGAEAARGP